MKHLLNDLSEEVKNSIREQHSGGKKIVIENFNKLINTKSGDVKLFLKEQNTELSKSPITTVTELTGADLTKFYNVMIAKYQKDKSFDGLTIHSMLLSNRDKNTKVSDIQGYINSETDNKPDLMTIYKSISDNEKDILASEGAKIMKR